MTLERDRVRMIIALYEYITLMYKYDMVSSTAILIIIDARYRDFNGFQVVNWY
jgi:hypothetical protein